MKAVSIFRLCKLLSQNKPQSVKRGTINLRWKTKPESHTLIWITSPASLSNHFTLHIHPAYGVGSIVRESNYTDAETLKSDLLVNLSPYPMLEQLVSRWVEEVNQNRIVRPART